MAKEFPVGIHFAMKKEMYDWLEAKTRVAKGGTIQSVIREIVAENMERKQA